jgi:tetratricopeptide (TPR) repeat protein
MISDILHFGRRAGHERRAAQARKRWYERTSVTLCVAAGLAVVGLGFLHVIVGVQSDYGLPFDVVRRDSFGYRETVVNARRIQSLPYTAAQRRYPRGLRALQKAGYLPDGHEFEARMMARQRERLQRWQAEFEKALGRPEDRWQEQLQNDGPVAPTDPDSAAAHNKRGIVCARRSEYAAALAEFTRAIRQDPTRADAFYNRALVYLALGNQGAAAGDLGQVVALRPEFVEGYLRRGRLYAAMNDHDQAIVEFTKALEIDPQCAEAYFHRSLAHYTKGTYDAAWADVHRLEGLGLPVPAGYLRALRGDVKPLEIESSHRH